jgi:hypothetical protein
MNWKNYLVAIMLTALMLALMFIPMSGSQTTPQYDPWVDLNDDGYINVKDAVILGAVFGTTGDPVNKTALLYNVNATLTELLSRIDRLNASVTWIQSKVDQLDILVTELQLRVLQLNASVATLNLEIDELRAYLTELESTMEARIPKKGYISISPAAFSPQSNTQTYYKYESYLRGNGAFWASLQLPDGVTITNITVRLYDSSTSGKICVYLFGYNLTKGTSLTIPMASIETTNSWAPGDIILYDDTIADAKIDNKNCVYGIEVFFSFDDISLFIRGITVEYEYSQ